MGGSNGRETIEMQAVRLESRKSGPSWPRLACRHGPGGALGHDCKPRACLGRLRLAAADLTRSRA
jgi:hypothetical protein